MVYLAEVNTPQRAYLDQLQGYKYSLCLAVPLCLLSRMGTLKDDITGNQSIKALLYCPCTQTFLWLIKSVQQCCFRGNRWWKPTKGSISNYVREHWFLHESFVLQRWLFEAKRDEVKWDVYVTASTKGKGGRTRPFTISVISHSCQLEPVPKKEPSSVWGKTPPESYVCVCVCVREEC